MTLLRPLPRAITRPVSLLILVAWVVVMGLLVQRSYLAAAPTMATDLARYGSAAVWRGVYYRGEKIGFTVSQTVPAADGFQLQEDGRLQMALLGAPSVAIIKTVARVDSAFALRSFDFSLDPGTGAIHVSGEVDTTNPQHPTLRLTTTSKSGSRSDVRDLDAVPILSQNLSRLLAANRLVEGATHTLSVFDPATLRNAPVVVHVGRREIVRGAERPVPAFRVEMDFQGLHTTSWVTDTGEVVREESPLGLISVQEAPARAQQLAVSNRMQSDLLSTAAVVPAMKQRIDEPRNVRRLRLRLDGIDLAPLDLDGVGQRFDGHAVEIRDTQTTPAIEPATDVARYLEAEPLIESDAPDIRAEAARAVPDPAVPARERAERLTRYVNALLEKKPTISLPSAREVLRTRVGDCNEHTALFVAMARALGLPARISVGLVFMRGAFYYHAWPEVFIETQRGRGYWLPVDPTLNQFPADATHVRLVRGGLDKQAAILPLIGRLKITVEDLELAPGSVPVLIGRESASLADIPVPAVPAGRTCRCDKEAATR